MVEKTTKLKNDREQPRQAWVLKTKKKVGTEAVQVRSSNPDVDEKGQWDGIARSCQGWGRGLASTSPSPLASLAKEMEDCGHRRDRNDVWSGLLE